MQLVHNGLHAGTTHTHASTDRVDGVVIGNYRDLRAGTRVTGHSFNLDDAVIDFWHFHFEQLCHELWRCAGQEDLRATGLATHVFDVDADTIIRAIAFATDLFVATQNRFAATDVHDDIAIFFALHQTINDGAGFVFELFVLTITLCFTDLLKDNLFRRLCRDTAQLNRWDLFHESVTNLWVFQILLGLLYGEFRLVVFQLFIFHNRAHTGESRLTGLAVDGHANVHFRAVARLGRTCQRFFHRFDNQTWVDHLLACNGFGGLQKLQLVCRGNCHLLSPPWNRCRFQSRQ